MAKGEAFQRAAGSEDPRRARAGGRFRARGPFVGCFLAGCVAVAGCLSLAGCSLPFVDHHRPATPLAPVTNPLFVPQQDPQFVWRQIADAVDDDFQIAKEEPLRMVDGVLTEGTLETWPAVGSTIFEPWREDSTPGYEKMYATLQSIRRRVCVFARPAVGGYDIEVQVHTELENLSQPETASFSREIIVPNNAVGERVDPQVQIPSGVRGWIPKGRDCSLERALLVDLRQRLTIDGVRPAGPK